MTHIFKIEDNKRSPDFGKEIIRSATVLDTPPMLVCAVRAYAQDPYGLHCVSEAWVKNPPEELERIFTLPENFSEENIKKIEENLNTVVKIRVLVITQPNQSQKKANAST